jgi:hypothetical protein
MSVPIPDSYWLCSYKLSPWAAPGIDGNFYLIAMFNKRHTDYLNRVSKLAEDPLIQSARVSMGVDKDQSLEATLQWYGWPLDWLEAEERQKEKARRAEEDARWAEEDARWAEEDARRAEDEGGQNTSLELSPQVSAH